MKVISWNVNGLRAIVKKNFEKAVRDLDADVLCLQETKANPQQVKEVLTILDGYEVYANAAKESKGYSGTAVMTRKSPESVTMDIGVAEHDKEGRVVTLEWRDFYLVNVYVPNSGRELVRLEYRKAWDKDFFHYLKSLESKKPVIVCGDFNVAHQPIDIARPKANYNKTAGYTQTEIDGFSNLLDNGLTDTFRHFHPDEIKYTWWSYRAGARQKNIGWRIDYCLVSDDWIDHVNQAFILNEFIGSDHCPLGIETK